ncbi:MAG: RlmE family RNA methyltransferase [Bdellovibrionales bacterium]|nr:RlmE family RNA methyltransferase [Bdellovibrionales bacterium]
MAYNPKDYYYHKAKEENYAARSVFKLQEIDQRLRIFRPGMKILDLGAAPGSWSQYASKKVGKLGRVLGIDIQPIKITLQNALFLTADMRELDLGKTMAEHGIEPPFDMVLSDMAPKTTGYRLQDQMRSLELCELALATAERFLRPEGTYICKIFHSDEFDNYRNKLREVFTKIDVIKPESVRKGSKEIFFIARGFKPRKA